MTSPGSSRSPAGRGGAGGDDGQDAAGPQHPLARRVQHAGAGAAAPGDGQGGLPRLRAAGLQQQGRAAGPGLCQRARRRAEVPVQAPPAAWQAAGPGNRPRTRRPAAAAAARSAPVAAAGMTTSSPGRENAVMTCAASGPGPGTGPGAGQTLTGTPIPGPLRPCRAADRRYPQGRTRRVARAPGPREVLGVTWAAGPAATADPLTLRKSGFRGLFSRRRREIAPRRQEMERRR